MALDAGPFMRLGTRGSPSWPGFDPETGYVDADCSDQIAEIACRRGGPYVCAGGRDMAADRGAVDAVAGIVRHRLGQRGGHCLPDAGFAPASEALVHGHPLPVLLRNVSPGRAGADAPEDAVDDGAVVLRRPALAPALRRQQIPQQTPFRFAQIPSTQDPSSPRGILESGRDSRVNHFVNRA